MQKRTLTRRDFVRGTVGVAAAAALGTSGLASTACSSSKTVDAADAASASDSSTASQTSALSPIEVTQDRVFTTEGCSYIENPAEAITLAAQAHLPYGTMLWASDDDCAACLLPCETSNPLTKVGILSFDTGKMTTVLETAVGADSGFAIYDVRANRQGVIWTESDILNQKWRIYTATLAGIMTDAAILGTPVLAAEGTGDWQLPELAVSGGYGFWQLCPTPDGPAEKEDSLLVRNAFGAPDTEAKVIYESAGSMACAPSTTASGIAIAPRDDASSKRYILAHIDAESGQVTDAMMLPTSMRPAFIAYGTSGFSFAFDSIYNFDNGISNLGTYTPVTADAPEGEWFCFSRTPYTDPAWCGNWLIVKSTSVIAGIDLANKRYFTMSPEYATQGYGEFLASTGATKRFVTYSNIDYTPLNSNRITECNVRIWQAA